MIEEDYKVAVLMTCHNRCNITYNCLKELFKMDIPDGYHVEVYLLDDGSTDGTKEMIRKYYTQVNYIQGNGYYYWNRGMHKLWEITLNKSFDFYIWLNDDTILKKDGFLTLFETYNRKINSIIVGSIFSYKNPDIFTYGGRSRERGFPLVNFQEEIQQCDTFNGNCVLIPKNICKSVGNLDSYFRHSFGDIEYGLRATKMGYNCFTTAAAVGFCERNNGIPKFLSLDKSIIERIRFLYSPLGYNPKEAFHLYLMHVSIIAAFAIFLKVHINAFFPRITNYYKKNKNLR